jgi:hypothetical protein
MDIDPFFNHFIALDWSLVLNGTLLENHSTDRGHTTIACASSRQQASQALKNIP